MSLMMVCMIFIMLVLSRASVSRIAEIFSETPDIRDDAADAACTLADGSVSFEDVSFRYDTGAGGEDVLSHISLQIAAAGQNRRNRWRDRFCQNNAGSADSAAL